MGETTAYILNTLNGFHCITGQINVETSVSSESFFTLTFFALVKIATITV